MRMRMMCSMLSTTVALTPAEVQRRREALGWSQNELARRIRKDPGMVSKVLHGYITSAVVWRKIDLVLSRAERRVARMSA